MFTRAGPTEIHVSQVTMEAVMLLKGEHFHTYQQPQDLQGPALAIMEEQRQARRHSEVLMMRQEL